MNDPGLILRFRSWLAGLFFEAAAKLDAAYDVYLDDAPPRYAVPGVRQCGGCGHDVHDALYCVMFRDDAVLLGACGCEWDAGLPSGGAA